MWTVDAVTQTVTIGLLLFTGNYKLAAEESLEFVLPFFPVHIFYGLGSLYDLFEIFVILCGGEISTGIC